MTKDLNNTLLQNIEYQQFCEKNKKDYECLPMSTMAAFFTTHSLKDFELVTLLWENQNNYDYIEDLFNLGPGYGQSLV